MDLTHDPCLIFGVHDTNAFTKAQILAMQQRKQKYLVGDYELKEVNARMISPNVGIVAYTVQLTLIMEDDELSFEATDTSTWMRQNGQWACAMHSEALFGHPFRLERKISSIPDDHLRR